MNRLLGQQAQTATRSSPSPSTDAARNNNNNNNNTTTMPETSKPPAAAKTGGSPHLADQARSTTPLPRKQIENRDPTNSSPGNNNNSNGQKTNGSEMYTFDNSPASSPRNSLTDLEMDPQVKLEDYDWGALEEQFSRKMEAFKAEEDAIWHEWEGWGEIFQAWVSTISVHDEDRASKRLRTRIAFTQGSEDALEAKRQHYIKVVQAFESALQLLGSRNSRHNFI